MHFQKKILAQKLLYLILTIFSSKGFLPKGLQVPPNLFLSNIFIQKDLQVLKNLAKPKNIHAIYSSLEITQI